jgi:Ca2+-binding EF-hand superfamily protein
MLQLPNAFNVQNTNTLAQALTRIEVNENTQLRSFDIVNMYTNFPTNEVKSKINSIIDKNNTSKDEKNNKPSKYNSREHYIQCNTIIQTE